MVKVLQPQTTTDEQVLDPVQVVEAVWDSRDEEALGWRDIKMEVVLQCRARECRQGRRVGEVDMRLGVLVECHMWREVGVLLRQCRKVWSAQTKDVAWVHVQAPKQANVENRVFDRRFGKGGVGQQTSQKGWSVADVVAWPAQVAQGCCMM